MFIATCNGTIILARDTREELEQCLKFMKYDFIGETDINYVLYEGEYLPEEEIAEKEKERIQKLSVTKSDFFDATIKAFGVDGNDLLPVVTNIISQAQIDEKLKKIALNNYQNAKDFYRCHEIFKVIEDIPLKISDDLVIQISGEQFDKFFDKADKKDPEAYKELLPKIVEV